MDLLRSEAGVSRKALATYADIECNHDSVLGPRFLNPALFYWVLFTAYDLLPAQDAMAINYTWGLTLPFIAACFSRSLPSVVEVSLALLSYVGILIIVTDGNLAGFEFENITGVMLAIGSTVLWGLSWVINTRTVERDQVDPELALLINFSMAVPVLWIILSATDSLRT